MLIFNGIIVSLIKFFQLQTPTSPINLIIIIYLPLFVGFFFKLNSKLKPVVTFFIFLLILNFLLKNNFDLTNILTLIIDATCLMAFFYYLNLSLKNASRILHLISKFFIIIPIIALIQYLFLDSLPEAFTELPNLFKDDIKDYEREYFGDIFFRPNGLIGNPITLGFILNFMIIIEYYLYLNYRNKFSLIKITFYSFIVFILLSRANIVLLALIFLGIISNFKLSRILLTISFVILTVIIFGAIFKQSDLISFYIERFYGEDSYAVASNVKHISDYFSALNVLNENFIFGVPPSYISDEKIITDGGAIILLLRHGIFIFIYLAFLFLYYLKSLYKMILKDKSLKPVIFILTVLPLYSLINSAILNKAIFILVFIISALIYNIAKNKIKNT